MELGDDFFALRKFVKGKISKYQLMESIELIERIHVDESNRAQSKVYLDFRDSDVFGRILGLKDDDIWFMQMVNNPYQSYDIYDSYQTDLNFKDGYGPFNDFDDDNIELMEKIAKLIYGKKLDFDSEEDKGNFVKFLDKYYTREIDSIVNDWTHEKNNEFMEVASKHVENSINEFLNKYGIERYGYGIKIPIADLISLYLQFGVPHLSIKELLKTIFKNSSDTIGGWDEDRYEYQDKDVFDTSGFNRDVTRALESILEKIEEDYDRGQLTDFMNMIDNITKKHKIGVWYEIPKNSELLFKINGFDRETKKISVSLEKRGVSFKKNEFKISEDGFNKLLYQPELFDLVEL